MSLLHLVHKNVILKFTDAAKDQIKPGANQVFRLTAVDGMGFLCLQDLKPDGHGGHAVASDPYWINKDVIRELHEFDLVKAKETSSHDDGAAAKAQAATESVRREATPRLPKAKQKSALKQKPDLN